MNNFGTGRRLSEASPQLSNAQRRHERILDVSERNSVIEGLPPFTPAIRATLRTKLEQMVTSEPAATLGE